VGAWAPRTISKPGSTADGLPLVASAAGCWGVASPIVWSAVPAAGTPVATSGDDAACPVPTGAAGLAEAVGVAGASGTEPGVVGAEAVGAVTGVATGWGGTDGDVCELGGAAGDDAGGAGAPTGAGGTDGSGDGAGSGLGAGVASRGGRRPSGST
jgi:hypothetical protein